MNENRLRRLLRDAPIPGERQAEERGLRIVAAAYDSRPPGPRPRLSPRLAIVLAVAAILLALVLSPAGAGVRDWIGDVVQPGVENSEPALTRLPGGGSLLVGTPQGPWVVHSDGSRRLLGGYREATWSPRGLFVAASSGRTLAALEPDGDAHWSLSRPRTISGIRWAPSGYRIAYLSGGQMRVVAGDGTGDRLLYGHVAPVAPSWRSGGGNVLTVARSAHDVRTVNVDSGRELGGYRAPRRVAALAWSADGDRLVLTSDRSVLVLDRSLSAVDRVDAPASDRIVVAAPAPVSSALAIVVRRRGDAGPPRSEVLLRSEGRGGPRSRTLFSAPGHLTDLAWSPDGRHLLVSWREADQWLFIPLRGRGPVTAVDGISRQFSPGDEHPAFPSVDVNGWCCPR